MINEIALTVGGSVATIRIPTRSGVEIVKLDLDDLEYAKKLHKLELYKDPKQRKMARSDKQDGRVLLHRYLFEPPKGYKLDWINGDTLDLRKENLQFVSSKGEPIPLAKPKEEVTTVGAETGRLQTQKPNVSNKPKGGSLADQPINGRAAEETPRGVVFHKGSGKWTARLHARDGSNVRHSLGYFETKEEAVAEALIFIAEGPESKKLKRNQRKGKN